MAMVLIAVVAVIVFVVLAVVVRMGRNAKDHGDL